MEYKRYVAKISKISMVSNRITLTDVRDYETGENICVTCRIRRSDLSMRNFHKMYVGVELAFDAVRAVDHLIYCKNFCTEHTFNGGLQTKEDGKTYFVDPHTSLGHLDRSLVKEVLNQGDFWHCLTCEYWDKDNNQVGPDCPKKRLKVKEKEGVSK